MYREIKSCAVCPAPVTGAHRESSRNRFGHPAYHVFFPSLKAADRRLRTPQKTIRGIHRKHKAMCRYYENFQSFPARERAVRGNGFSLLSPISPSRAVVSLTLYDGAIPASATADIGPVKERAGIPGTAKEQHRAKGQGRDSTEPQFTRLEPVSSPANTTDDTGSSCTRGPYQVLKGCAVRMSPLNRR